MKLPKISSTGNNNAGFAQLVIVLVLLAAVSSFVVVRHIVQTQSKTTNTHSLDTSYLSVLGSFKALKQKAQDDGQKGASTSAVVAQFPQILLFVKENQNDNALKLIASLSAQLDANLAAKLEADRIASEAAKKKAQQDAARQAAVAVQQTPVATPAPAPAPSNPPPTQTAGNGYSHITVSNDHGSFAVDVIKVDLGSGDRIITDSGNTTDCADGCIALPFTEYLNRNNAYAGMNGTYFCPPDYSFCDGKTNSFNWFVFNYPAKTFLNADKRDYSNAGSLFVFRPGSVTFYRNPQSFGLDTSITGAIASFPTMLADGAWVLDDSLMDDKQRTTKGNRGGLGNSGNTVYLVIAHNATVPDLASVMQTMGITNAVNLDGGGSSTMYDGGFKDGPGRQLPNVILVAH